jgi:hypothetical protein
VDDPGADDVQHHGDGGVRVAAHRTAHQRQAHETQQKHGDDQPFPQRISGIGIDDAPHDAETGNDDGCGHRQAPVDV